MNRALGKILVIAYGNPLRSDDGLAWHAADELVQSSPDLEVIRAHQLTPELAEAVSQSEAVIFVDAAREGAPGDISCSIVEDQPVSFHVSHYFTPSGIMALAQEHYTRRPPAFCVSMAGENFDHGDRLSPNVAAALPELSRTVAELAAERIASAAD